MFPLSILSSHRLHAVIDAGHCYKRSNIPYSVCLLCTAVSPTKTDEPIEMSFEGKVAWAKNILKDGRVPQRERVLLGDIYPTPLAQCPVFASSGRNHSVQQRRHAAAMRTGCRYYHCSNLFSIIVMCLVVLLMI